MCTSFLLKGFNAVFARNMDIDFSLNEKLIIIPKNYPIILKKEEDVLTNHFAIMGIGTVINDYPLIADAMNEKGLAAAALNFMDNAKYYKYDTTKFNLAPYELILYLLSKCCSIEEIKKELEDINVIDINFSEQIINTPLHFMFSDKTSSIVVETTKEGMRVYENDYDVLTNNPPFPFHVENIKHYIHLTTEEINNTFDTNMEIKNYSLGQGAFGLPGDFSSSSRFIKTLFIKNNMKFNNGEKDAITHAFKCLSSVSMIDGIVQTSKGYELTQYQVCYDLLKKKLYYRNYDEKYFEFKLEDRDLNDNKLYTIELVEN